MMPSRNGLFSAARSPAARAPEDVGRRRARAGAGETRRATCTALASFSLTMLLLNGSFFHEDAQRRAYGRWHAAWVQATRPAAWLSEKTGGARFREQLEAWFETWGLKL